MFRLKVTAIRSGKGSPRHVVTIPKEVYARLGTPNEVIMEYSYDRLILKPVKNIIVGEASEEEVLGIRSESRGVDERRVACINVLDHVKTMSCIHGSPTTILVNCIDTNEEHTAYIAYLDGYGEKIREGLSCGYEGTSPGALVNLIAWLSGHSRVDPEIEKVETIIKANTTKTILVYNMPSRVEVAVLKKPQG